MATPGNELASLLHLLEDASNPTLALLQGLWRAHDPDMWSGDPAIYIRLGERILQLGEPLFGYDVIGEGIKLFPENVQLRQLLALALARGGATASANAVLVRLYEEGYRDEETVGLLARTHKDLASEAVDAADAHEHLRQAYVFYAEAYESTGGYWSAINAATLALLLGHRERATALARQITVLCREKLGLGAAAGDRYWLLSTLGEAALLLDHGSEAEDWYSQAVAAGEGDWGSLQSTRRNARMLMQQLDADSSRIERLFKVPNVVVFSGHMIDQPERAAPRFPPQLERTVEQAIRQRVKELNAGFGFAGAACGSDILFHEAILDLKGETHVVLPCHGGLFRKESVDIVPGANWGERYERVIAGAVEVQEASRQSRMSGVLYDFTNLLLYGLASVRAGQLETRLVPLVVWDGKSGDGAGGTAHAVERWQALGLDIEVIDLSMAPRVCLHVTSPSGAGGDTGSRQESEVSPGFTPGIRAMLFADAEGFSKLNDEEIPRFVDHFLGLVARLSKESGYSPLTKNTWGDGLYMVFANVRDAGQFALELSDNVRRVDWAAKGLPNLNLRIGLHAGPVYSCTDPVTERLNYVGPHVSRAARIEPITPVGQVYASQEFAALAAAENVKELRCEYVGRTAMAKKYGTFGTYVVRRRHKTGVRPSWPATSN